jgi:hypothetical protein
MASGKVSAILGLDDVDSFPVGHGWLPFADHGRRGPGTNDTPERRYPAWRDRAHLLAAVLRRGAQARGPGSSRCHSQRPVERALFVDEASSRERSSAHKSKGGVVAVSMMLERNPPA